MLSHRTTARGILLPLLAAGLAAAVAVLPARAAPGKVPELIFPVVGAASYTDDFGDARGSGGHQGNDIIAAKRSLAVAVEAGRVKFHTTSWRAGCMLYLYGASGTTYIYVHLNNDVGTGNDNAGKCVAGVAYANGLRSGAKVAAGQHVAFVGDSGDADGANSHLHFEVHPGGGAAVSPYPYLRKARKLLFAVQPGKLFTAALRGKILTARTDALTMNVDRVQSWPGGVRVTGIGRAVQLAMPPHTAVFSPVGALAAAARAAALKRGEAAVAWTAKTSATLDAALGEPLAMATEKVVLGAATAMPATAPKPSPPTRPFPLRTSGPN